MKASQSIGPRMLKSSKLSMHCTMLFANNAFHGSLESNCPVSLKFFSQHVASPEVFGDVLHCLSFLGAMMVAAGYTLWSKRQAASEQSQSSSKAGSCGQASPMKIHDKAAMLRVKRLAECIEDNAVCTAIF